MTMKVYQPLDLVFNELRNFFAQNLAGNPVTGVVAGRIYYDTTGGPPGVLKYYNGSTWISILASGTGDVVGPAASVDSEVALFSSTTGKLLKRASISGIAKLTSGVLSAGTSGTDYAPGTSGNTTGLVKSTTATGALTTAVAGTDYVGATSGSAVQKASSGGLTAATVRTDYAEPTTALTTGLLKNTTATGAHTIAVEGTDYWKPGGTDVAIADGGTGVSTLPTGVLVGAGTGAITAATPGTTFYAPGSTDVTIADGGTGVSTLPAGILVGAGTSAITAAVQGTDYWKPGGTDVAIADGGTGASTLPTGILVGAGTGAITAAVQGTDYYKPTGTDVAIADGGTGVSTLGTYALKGNGTGAISQAALSDLGATTADFSMASHKITSLTSGTAATDAVNLGQVQDLINTGTNKTSVRGASTANLAVATALVNGLVHDGVTYATGERIFLKNQTAGAENGIYNIVASGAASRATDADLSAEVKSGLSVWVNEGTANGKTRWVLTTNDPITLGTTALVFTQDFAANSTNAGGGLTATGIVIAVGAGVGITVNADDVAVDTTLVARYKSGLIGNAAATSFTVTHGITLGAPTSQSISVWDVATGEQVYPSVVATSTTVDTIDFGAFVPTSNQFRWELVG